MPLRLIAFLLASALFWSGLGTIEAPWAAAQAAHEQTPAIAHGGGQAPGHEGSVEHHHLDDLPSQANHDVPPDTPGMLPSLATPPGAAAVMATPRGLASAGIGPPFLAGPLRPPSGMARAA